MAYCKGVAILALIVGAAIAQQKPADLPSFDAASIKPNPHDKPGFSDQKIAGPGRFVAINSNLDECIRWAYELEEYRISEPESLKSSSNTFDIEATAPAETTPAQIHLMVRRLIAERFGVVLHTETKTMSAYSLSIDKGGPKLRDAGLSGPKMTTSRRGGLTSASLNMTRFASALARELHRPVIDKTGLTGFYAIDLAYAPPDSVEASGAPSIFTAIQELGLRLESVQAPVDIIVVDRANKTFTPN